MSPLPRGTCLLLLGLLLGPLLWPATAGAHGGLPLSTEIVWRKDRMYVPTQYWGIFVGPEGGPWRWICDEAINNYKLREVFLGGDDTFYATDLTGLTLSRDGGCNWAQVTGPLAAAEVSAIAPDPVAPARVYVTAVTDGKPTLYRSDDSGRSFAALYTAPGQAQRGLALSADGARIYLSALRLDGGPMPLPTLYLSTDGGASFQGKELTPRPPFLRTVPLAVDSRDGKVVYVVNQGDPTQVLLRVDGDSGASRELLRVEGAIFAVAVDAARGRLLAATAQGLYYGDSADGTAPLARSEGLSRAQCASVQGGALYACSWNYYPDLAAIARSDDGGLTFRKTFQYAETQGVLQCPAGSGVARICPGVWDTYASLLGIETGAGADMGGGPDPQPGCSCALGRGGQGGGWGEGGAAWLLGLLGALALRRRRRRPRV